ncbi:MAG: T9SS type A sorting domain-containing protein [Flavobacteriales bacterium]|nr:T9SS type A sorting domain-containing protein [Flavobacteriales bacterium]
MSKLSGFKASQVFVFFLLLGLGFANNVPAQQILAAEYFFDTDPGPGNGTSISIGAPGDPLDLTLDISTGTLSPGFHTVNIRFKENNGQWGLYDGRPFYVQAAPIIVPPVLTSGLIVAAEYFFDNDPGVGKATPINIGAPGDPLDLTFDISTGTLSPGFHTVNIRFKEDNGQWGLYDGRPFYVQAAPIIVPPVHTCGLILAAEYFIDNDPGVGNGIPIAIAANSNLDLILDVSTIGLLPGFHSVNIRFKDVGGHWSLYDGRPFYVQEAAIPPAPILPPPLIVSAEYFFDNDPGAGNGTPIPIGAPALDHDLLLDIPTGVLSSGLHSVNIRFKAADLDWGLYDARSFFVCTTVVTASVTTSNIGCNGNCDGSATVSVLGGTAPFTYLWDDPGAQINATASGLCAGTFNVTITEAGGCAIVESVTILEPAPISPTTSAIEPTCGGSDGSVSVTVSGGTAPYNFQWNDPGLQTTSTVGGLAAGTYTVTVTDANGCLVTATEILDNSSLITATVASTSASCNGGNDGTASVTPVGGTAPYNFAWDDPLAQITTTVIGLTIGQYTVTVTDVTGCIAIASVNVTESAAPVISVSGTNTSCNGVCDGTAIASPSGGTSPYSFLWDDPLAQTNATASGLCSGTLNVTVTDARGCATTANITITELLSLSITTSTTDLSCNGICIGMANAASSGGAAPYSYSWDDPLTQTNSMAISLCAGTFGVTITDANGCTASTSIAIAEPLPLSVSSSGTDLSCNGICTGTATATPSGGTGPYNFAWDDALAQTKATATGLCSGFFTVTITDVNGCTVTSAVTVNESTPIVLSVSSIDATCGLSDGQASIVTTGGTAPYTFLWDDLGAQSTATAVGLVAGVFKATVTDANGCISVELVSVDNAGGPVVTVSSSTIVSCNGGSDGEATVTILGGVSPFSILWDDPNSQTTVTATGLNAGTSTVTVTDPGGCVSSGFVTITEISAISVASSGTGVSCVGNCDGTVTATPVGGTPPYTFLWDDPLAQTTATANGLCLGAYIVTVTDANGCSAELTCPIITSPAALIVATSATDVSCNGGDGTASVSATGGTSPFTYLWDDPLSQATATAVGLTQGIFLVVVTDNNGCIVSETAAVGNGCSGCSLPATASAGADATICEGNPITLAGAFGGSASSSTWTTSGTGVFDDVTLVGATYTPSAADELAGAVTLTLTTDDPAGPCVAADDLMTLTIDKIATANAGADATICEGNLFTLTGAFSGSALASTWTSSGTGTFDNAALLAATYTPSAADETAGSVTLTLTTDDPAGPCVAALNLMILTIDQIPTANAGADATICAGNPITLAGAFGGGASSITWTTSGSGTFDDGTDPTTSYSPSPADITVGTVTLTITTDDPGGPCPAASDAVILTFDASPTADAGPDRTVITGFPKGLNADCVDLTSVITGGLGPFSYLWSTGETTPTITVCPTIATNFTVVVTGVNGCSGSDEVNVNVIDIVDLPPCPSSPKKKIEICHIATCTDSCAKLIGKCGDCLIQHLAHGDYLGPCTGSGPCPSPSTAKTVPPVLDDETDQYNEDTLEVYDPFSDAAYEQSLENTTIVFPDPNDGRFTLMMVAANKEDLPSIYLYNTLGQILYKEENLNRYVIYFNISDQPKGIYFIKVIKGNSVYTHKIIYQ